MLFIFAFSVVAADLQTRAGHVPRAVSQLKPVAELESTRQVKLAIGLPLRNREALLNLLQQLYDPSSPQYRHFLTPQQFAERFAPTEDDYQRVIAFAKSNHFVITGRHANRLLLDVTASSADINRALHLRLRVYQHPIEPRQFYAPDAEPSLDSRTPVLTIAGLDDFFIPRPVDLKMQLSPQPQKSAAVAVLESVPASQSDKPRPQLTATGSGPTGAFLGRDFRNAYAPGVALDGRGESIGLLQFDTYYPNDVSEYEDLAGLPKVPLTNVLVDGFNRLPGDNNGEVALDIAMAISMAPGLDRVFVYEGTIGNDILNRMATDNLARQLSSSWSFGPQVDATREQIFQQFAAQGQSFFEASGDSGAYTIPNPPADDPFVTAVGGTSLVVAQPEGKWVSESAWQFSGGGTSFVYSIPAWQKSVNMALNQGSSTMRNVPDVAALADNVIWSVANNGQQGTVAGTSASAPLWAGFAALVNQQAAANRQPAVGFLNPALYAIGQSPLYASCFHDVTNGNNTTSESPNRFFAVTGYDLVTGWGTPTGSNLINALLAPPGTLQISASAGVSFSGPLGGPFTPLSQTYWLTNAGQSPLSWTLGNVPSWLSASSSSGVINAGQASSVSLNIMLSAAANLAPGSYIATLWFTNLSDAVLQRRTAELDVVTSPIITSQPTTQTLPVGATARFVVTAATNALLSFQWQANGIKLSDGGGIFGSRTAELTLTNVTSVNNGTYQVIL
ncbi:MAG TPA: protease pro-enzyme activation domain-containing protein, partial [Patescibacteria group bacterium]|nr:protease pro-enzyme activation domain-containing protein [Patescibacteria group bacterium]